MAAVLIFPANTSESAYQASLLRAAGHYVVGAGCDIDKLLVPTTFDELVYLPHMASDDFMVEFASLCQRFKIKWVASYHFVVRTKLQALAQQYGWDLEFLNARPDRTFVAQQQRYQALLQAFNPVQLAKSLAIAPEHLMSLTQQLTLLQHFDGIAGESPYEKILAMMVIGAAAPTGDLVEIGCLYGKSAFALGYINQCYQLGAVLCVDPWDMDMSLQHEADHLVQDVNRHEIFSIGFQYFVQNLQPYFTGTLNVLQASSQQAYPQYCAHACVTSEAFGRTEYQRAISILHIDGNHDYAFVSQELATWGTHVVAGGWIILDDYLWGLGAGPDKAGNEFLQTQQARIQHAFVIGEALFIQLKAVGGTCEIN